MLNLILSGICVWLGQGTYLRRPADINLDLEMDPVTGLDNDLLRFAEELEKGNTVQVGIAPSLLRGTKPAKEKFMKQKKLNEESHRLKMSHFITLCGIYYDPKDGHLAGFFFKDTGWDEVNYVTAETLNRGIRGIKSEDPGKSIGTNKHCYVVFKKVEDEPKDEE